MHHVPQSYAVIQRTVRSKLLCVDGNIDKALKLKACTAQLLFCALKDMQCVDKIRLTCVAHNMFVIVNALLFRIIIQVAV